MTDIRPYQTYNEISVVLAIAQGKSPANIGDLVAPNFVRGMLERCWRVLGDERPTMVWCTEVLTQHTTGLFDAYIVKPFNEIPTEFKASEDGWRVVYNPASRIRYDCQFPGTVGDLSD